MHTQTQSVYTRHTRDRNSRRDQNNIHPATPAATRDVVKQMLLDVHWSSNTVTEVP